LIVTKVAANACDEGGTTSFCIFMWTVFPEILSKSFILNI